MQSCVSLGAQPQAKNQIRVNIAKGDERGAVILEEQRAEPEVKFSGGRIRYFQHIRWLTCPKLNTEQRVAGEGDARIVRESKS